MTPAQWVKPRATEWAEWVEQQEAQRDEARCRTSSFAERIGSGGGGYGHAIDYVIFDRQRCEAFDAEVGGLPDPLRVVFRMHWLGSECRRYSSATPVEVKAGLVGLSLSGYYLRLNNATTALYEALA